MKTGKGMGKFLVSGTRVASLALVIVAASAASGGYGDLPDTFDASTGYVTLNANVGLVHDGCRHAG